MPVCGSGVLVCSSSLLIRRAQRARCQAETPPILLSRFPEPALTAIMLKDKKKYTSTGGWGFQAWAGGDPTKPFVTDPTKQCFECHQARKDQDYVYSTYIP